MPHLDFLHGAVAIGAANGEAALALAADKKPQIIFCDIRMPRMDGFEFLTRLRAIPEMALVPVIAMSGVGSDVGLAQIRAAGFTGHLTKPVTPDAIGAYLRGL